MTDRLEKDGEPRSTRPVLLLGAGRRVHEVGAVLSTLAALDEDGERSHEALALFGVADLEQLLAQKPLEGWLILEAGRVPGEDIGFVRRFLERHAGWRLLVLADDPAEPRAKALLGFERIAIGSPRLSANALAAMQRLATAMGRAEDPVLADRIARFRLDLADLKALYESHVAALKRGEELGPDASILKIVASELFQRISEAMLELAGENAGLLHPMPGPALHPAGQFLLARPSTIFGGSSEILRNVLSRSLLDLPA